MAPRAIRAYLRFFGWLPAGLVLAGCGADDAVDEPTADTEVASTGSESTGSEDSGEPEPLPDDDGTTTGEDPIEPLPWQSDCTLGATDLGVLHPRLECVGVDVPLDWDDPGSMTVQIAAFRVRTTVEERVGQMWLLDGGPGGSGLWFFESPMLDSLLSAGFDVIVPAHRGTLAPRLHCASSGTSLCRAELEAQWGDGLRHFSTLQAAADLGALIEHSSVDEPGRIAVYGVSYGSFWAQYYLTLHPTQADVVILDGVLPMHSPVLEQKVVQQAAAVQMLQRCVDDPDCGPAVGFESGEAHANAVVEAVDGGACGSFEGLGWASSGLRQKFGLLLNTPRARSFMPLLAAMLHRCTPELTTLANTALTQLWEHAVGLAAPLPSLPLTSWSGSETGYRLDFEHYFSPELSAVVMSTSILPDDGDPYAVTEQAVGHLVGLGFGQMFVENYGVWGDIPNAEIPAQGPAEIPVLVLSAAFDLQTPLGWAQAVATTLEQPVFVFDDAAHGVVGDGGADEASIACGRSLMLSFAIDGELANETSCVGEVPPVDVNLDSPELRAMAEHAFGTPDPWSLLD